MKEYTGQPGLIPGLGIVNPGDKIDDSKLNQKLLGKLSGRLKTIKNTSNDNTKDIKSPNTKTSSTLKSEVL